MRYESFSRDTTVQKFASFESYLVAKIAKRDDVNSIVAASVNFLSLPAPVVIRHLYNICIKLRSHMHLLIDFNEPQLSRGTLIAIHINQVS